MATCKDCLHNAVCALWRANEGQDAKCYSENGDEWECDFFTDKSRCIELPCKIGDTVYYLGGGIRKNRIKTAIVEEIIIDRNGIRDLVVTVENGSTFGMPFSTFSITHEEASKERTSKS